MADYGACPSVPVPVMEVLLGASSEHRPMLLLLPPCLAALASIKSEMEQQTIVAATRPLDRFPLLAAEAAVHWTQRGRLELRGAQRGAREGRLGAELQPAARAARSQAQVAAQSGLPKDS